ncbi:7 transmembrane sweet-taste receptor of 3 GCPR-domain containing protein [Nitzschia inconspicua]|uniref:7 transmembrane sweet-taste receptor of 3 GCPR-domain containing protein n=1 Tax=Nitzschia inconspicua TaxID=303405 RepID=A0A9K3PRS4_9STRA|nr:7 transmembrane sweet-taste receptor of 3 GCPR-domain containing protein [Nitzschia inconspicua]
MWWWKPDALVEEFFGSSSSFQQVLLPEATETCSLNRVDTEARCSDDIWQRRGDERGACDQEFHALLRVVSLSFLQQALAEPLDTKSPGYGLVKNLKLSDLELNAMLRSWVEKRVDPFGNDAREAVCSWVVENYDNLLEFLPPGYPKQIDMVDSYEEGYMIGALVCAVVASLAVIVIAAASYKYRHRRVIVYAQLHILFFILLGFFFISIGAILLAVVPTPAICMAQIWLVNLGYSVHLIPLLVKVAAINKIMSSAKKMKRVKIKKEQMLKVMGGLLLLVVIYLIVWSAVDPVKVVEQRTVTNATSTVVEECITCSSQNYFWYYIAIGFQGLLLIIASALAFQSRDTIPEFDESRTLGTMIYSHSLFMALRCVIMLFDVREIFQPGVSSAVLSYLLSLDTITAMGIYLVPKLLQARASQDIVHQRRAALGGVHTSFAVGNIEAMAAQSVLCSQASVPPRIAMRQGRGFLASSQLGDVTPDLASSASLVHSGSNNSSLQRSSGSSLQLMQTALQLARPQPVSELMETSAYPADSTLFYEESQAVLKQHPIIRPEMNLGDAEMMVEEEVRSSTADSDEFDLGGPRFRSSRFNTETDEGPASPITSSITSPELTADEEGKTK